MIPGVSLLDSSYPFPKPIIAKNVMFIGVHLPVFGKSDLNTARISLIFSIASTVQRK